MIKMNKPIGIFDSGVGGLTVFREIRKKLPEKDIIYFGDTARVPYGSKSKNTIIQYSLQNAAFLIRQNIKILVVACNTSSAYAIDELKKHFHIPIIGVIEPGAIKALEMTRNKRIGIIGTYGTIKSGSYEKSLKALSKDCYIFSKATPLLVPLVEENWIDHQVSKMIIKEYLTELLKQKIDTLILGCTHYPVLKKVIKEVVGKDVQLVDSAESVAQKIQQFFSEESSGERIGNNTFYISDNPEKFKLLGKQILKQDLENVHKVYFSDAWIVDNLEKQI